VHSNCRLNHNVLLADNAYKDCLGDHLRWREGELVHVLYIIGQPSLNITFLHPVRCEGTSESEEMSGGHLSAGYTLLKG